MNAWSPASWLRRLFDSECGAPDRFLPRWIFLRAIGLIYYSAFFSLVFQIRGLIGPRGILPANEYLQAVAERFGHAGYWYAPTLLWFSSSSGMITGICRAGMIASVLLVLNFWPRGMLAVCFVCFLSFVTAAHSNPVLSDFDALANRNYSFRKLHFSELPGPRAGFSLAR